jgi:hypothetical protein
VCYASDFLQCEQLHTSGTLYTKTLSRYSKQSFEINFETQCVTIEGLTFNFKDLQDVQKEELGHTD